MATNKTIPTVGALQAAMKNISALPPGTVVSHGAAQGSMIMASFAPSTQEWGFAAPSAPAKPPCPFSHDDVAALRAIAQPLRRALGAPHEPVVDASELATLTIKLELITKKIDAMITLAQP